MPAAHNRTGVLVRLVARCDTAAAPCEPATTRWPLRLLLVAGVLATGLAPVGAAVATPAVGPGPGPGGGAGVRARYAILVDPATGAVLWGRQEPHGRAAGQPDQDADRAGRPGKPGPGRRDGGLAGGGQPAGPSPGDEARPEATVDQALKALMMVSANDVAVMLAETAGGSVARFSRAMDAESELLGLRASSWRNPHGLDAPGHRSTAFDLAILAGPCSRTAGWPGSCAAATRPSRPRAAAGTHSPPAPGSCSATGVPSGSRPASPTTPGTAWPPRPPGAGGP